MVSLTELKYYIAKRLILLVPILLCTVAITFVAVRSIRGDPVAMFFGEQTTYSEELMAKLRHDLGLDQPLYVQYAIYLRNLLTGNLGYSVFYHRPVVDDLAQFLPATIELGIAAILISVALGIPLGIVCAIKKDTWVDHLLRVISMIGVSQPAFWSAIMLQMVFYGQLAILPVGGRIDTGIHLTTITGFYVFDSILTGNGPALISSLYHLILPAIALSFSAFATFVKISRSSMLEVLGQEYIRTVKAYGFSDLRVYLKYAFRNALTSNFTVLGLVIANMLGGAFLVEIIFNWPGIGRYTITAINNSDYMPLTSVTLVLTVGYVLVNLLVDILYMKADPRIKM
ncbi:ABC transporter permease [Candidatus Bathyarchaeota archaeon]|nr:ABC transporter permease [Candidatus Bathyarchaeota archaeon]